MQLDPAVTTFLALLAKANSVRVDSPLLTWWDTFDPSGDMDHVVVDFSWSESGANYSVALTEGGIAKGKWIGESFFCADSEGNGVELSLFRHVAIVPGE